MVFYTSHPIKQKLLSLFIARARRPLTISNLTDNKKHKYLKFRWGGGVYTLEEKGHQMWEREPCETKIFLCPHKKKGRSCTFVWVSLLFLEKGGRPKPNFSSSPPHKQIIIYIIKPYTLFLLTPNLRKTRKVIVVQTGQSGKSEEESGARENGRGGHFYSIHARIRRKIETIWKNKNFYWAIISSWYSPNIKKGGRPKPPVRNN